MSIINNIVRCPCVAMVSIKIENAKQFIASTLYAILFMIEPRWSFQVKDQKFRIVDFITSPERQLAVRTKRLGVAAPASARGG
jgi:hypothetical protein